MDHRIVIYAVDVMFEYNVEIAIGLVIESYLSRESSVTDHDTNELLVVVRAFLDKTIPQGSILSPKLWRIYEPLASTPWSDITEIELKVSQVVICYAGLVAYADDHVTVVAIMVKREISLTYRRELVFNKIWDMRCLIKGSTIDMGCDVEPSKSETVFSFRVVDKKYEDSRFQASFKWLGYNLSVKNSGLLWFEDKPVEKKLNSLEFYARSIFQYSNSIAFRWKIWKCYFAPFVEFFLPVVFQKGILTRTRIHTFQHRLTSLACDLPVCASESRVQKATGEPSVEFKA